MPPKIALFEKKNSLQRYYPVFPHTSARRNVAQLASPANRMDVKALVSPKHLKPSKAHRKAAVSKNRVVTLKMVSRAANV